MSWVSVVTDAGRSLMSTIPSGSRLVIDKATVGSGTVEEVNLRQQIAVSSEKMDATIANVTKTGGYFNYTKMKINVGPAPNLTGAFTAHQIGVWGRLDGEGDYTLLYLAQDSGSGVSVPTVSTSSSFLFAMYLYLVCQNDETMTINVDGGAYVDQEQLDDEKAEFDDKYVHYTDLANGGQTLNTKFALDARQGARIDDLDGKVMKILTGQAGGSVVVPYAAAKGVEAVLIVKPPVQTGSGTPSSSNIRPFTVETYKYMSYAYKVPGSSTWTNKTVMEQSTTDYQICGSMYNIMTRQFFKTHGYIASYAGEKLPGKWLSDRNAYVEGTSPSIGAEVVYELPGPQRFGVMKPASVAFEFTDEGDYEFKGGGTDGYVIVRMYPKVDDKIDRSEIVNNLNSGGTTVPLSAAQGKALNDKITNLETLKFGQQSVTILPSSSVEVTLDGVVAGRMYMVGMTAGNASLFHYAGFLFSSAAYSALYTVNAATLTVELVNYEKLKITNNHGSADVTLYINVVG